MRLRGVAALVTGGGSGLGAASAAALAEAGARVAVLDRDFASAASVAARIDGLALEADVTDAGLLERAIGAAEARHGPARVLVNCAGVAHGARIAGRDGPHPLDAFERVVAVNLVGTFNALRLAASRMVALEPLDDGERGVVVNTASIAAFDGQIGQAAYAASKAGVVGLTLPAARELAEHGVRVCTIAPGVFDTAMVAGLPEPVREALAAGVPFPRRLGRPAEFAALVRHVCENVMLNGETIRLDGALRMPPR